MQKSAGKCNLDMKRMRKKRWLSKVARYAQSATEQPFNYSRSFWQAR